jgi:methionine sulfoxide reductase heme-binding subunit
VKSQEPFHVFWWLVSRASGVVALVLITLSVLMGLSMAARVLRPGAGKRAVARLHEHVALTALAAIGLHGLSLLGDQWLNPGVRGIAVPFALAYKPTFTGIGVIAGYMAVLVGPSFYLRRLVGAKRWRKVHRVSVVIWALSAVHTLGAGSDSSQTWLRALVILPVAPLAYLLVLRLLRGGPAPSLAAVPARSENPHRASAPIDTALASSAVASMPASRPVSAKNRRVAGMSRAAM